MIHGSIDTYDAESSGIKKKKKINTNHRNHTNKSITDKRMLQKFNSDPTSLFVKICRLPEEHRGHVTAQSTA